MSQDDAENQALAESQTDAQRSDSDSEHAHSIEVVSASWEGPLPPPGVLRQYDDVQPGFAERIVRMAEKQVDARIQQANDRIQIEKTVVIGDSRRGYLGIVCAFVLSLLIISLGAYSVIWGDARVGVAVISANIAGLAYVFVYGANSRRRERQAADAESQLDGGD